MMAYLVAASVSFCLGVMFDRLLLAERWRRARLYESTYRKAVEQGCF